MLTLFDIIHLLMPHLKDLLFFGGGLLLLALMARLYMHSRSPIRVIRRRPWLMPFGIVLALAITALGGWMKYKVEFYDGMYCPSVNARQPDGWNIVDLRFFRIGLPADWRYRPQQGIDSFVGVLKNDDMRLSFDKGWFSNPLEDWNRPDFDRYCLRIDGYRAVILNEIGTRTGRIGIHFPNLGGYYGAIEKLTMTGEGTPAQRDMAILAFQQIRFD